LPEPQRFVLFYDKQSFLVRVVLTRQTAESRVKPYPEIVVRAKAALEKAHKSGQISFYDIYEEELNRVWSDFRAGTVMAERRILERTKVFLRHVTRICLLR